MKQNWMSPTTLAPLSYTCGFCGNLVGSDKGYQTSDETRRVYLCPNCGRASDWIAPGTLTPAAPFGQIVTELPATVRDLYEEARRCMSAGSPTSAVLTCRKILMHVAVEQEAKPGKNFIEYVEYLSDKGFIPPNGKGWVDHIRTKGNEANHEIVVMSRGEAELQLTFLEMLLRFVYEFPKKVPAPA
jgi:DNA-directed RNA polymerase subunit RPC12/RpoP